ncbi:hypothetical protein ETAA8_33570 [Anatilimnocola aggregata]|uniref:Uncharacterized protein n=2 Tax=Anatilimnocola aggregata TaxID=2528021 RepID=A0A517YDE5_9BACT|nr:hypothetical protein ETAA8_33570 [Anatilimnocola aggregata]
MDHDDGYAFPAANIGDTDLVALAQTNPTAAKEIARLEVLLSRGEETKEEFLQLCQLLFDVGSISASEILLRRNLDYYEGHALYVRLHGSAKQEEFATAIAAFKSQFEVDLVLMAENYFLVSMFRSNGGPRRFDDLVLLSSPCEIKFGYIEQDKVEADVTLLDPGREVFAADECLLLFFVNGVWELADPLDT